MLIDNQLGQGIAHMRNEKDGEGGAVNTREVMDRAGTESPHHEVHVSRGDHELCLQLTDVHTFRNFLSFAVPPW